MANPLRGTAKIPINMAGDLLQRGRFEMLMGNRLSLWEASESIATRIEITTVSNKEESLTRLSLTEVDQPAAVSWWPMSSMVEATGLELFQLVSS